MGRFYASEGMVCDPLGVVYACVCGVMSVRVRASVMMVMKEECGNKIKNNHNFGLRTLLQHTLK